MIGRPVAAQMQLHAKVRAESAAREPKREMPARVACRDAVMERREARVLDRKRTRRRKAAIQDEALSGAPSPSVWRRG